MKADIRQVDPLHLRLIGAIFWSVLLIYWVPQWFQHPVDFSPNAQAIAHVSTSTSETMSTNASSVASEAEVPHAELYIEKPLTTEAPPANPALVQSLAQPLPIKEAQVDSRGKISAASSDQLAFARAPVTTPGGHYWVQIATYQLMHIAQDTQQRIQAQGFVGHIVHRKTKKGQTLYVLRVGPYQTLKDAQSAKHILDATLKAKTLVLKL